MRSNYLVAFIVLLLIQPVLAEQGTVRIGDQKFDVDIVRTPEDRVRGLSGRPDLKPNTGMLFVFDKPGMYGIWMKDMLFPIDILWVNQFGSIVHIERQASPDSYPRRFQAAKPALYVLEIPAGAGQSFTVNMPVYFKNISHQ